MERRCESCDYGVAYGERTQCETCLRRCVKPSDPVWTFLGGSVAEILEKRQRWEYARPSWRLSYLSGQREPLPVTKSRPFGGYQYRVRYLIRRAR